MSAVHAAEAAHHALVISAERHVGLLVDSLSAAALLYFHFKVHLRSGVNFPRACIQYSKWGIQETYILRHFTVSHEQLRHQRQRYENP